MMLLTGWWPHLCVALRQVVAWRWPNSLNLKFHPGTLIRILGGAGLSCMLVFPPCTLVCSIFWSGIGCRAAALKRLIVLGFHLHILFYFWHALGCSTVRWVKSNQNREILSLSPLTALANEVSKSCDRFLACKHFLASSEGRSRY